MKLRARAFVSVLCVALTVTAVTAGPLPKVARTGMVVSANEIASRVGADVIRAGGNAVDAAVATAFALAVTYPFAGNIGGGGFMVVRSASGEAVAYDFREMAPAASHPQMFQRDGEYDATLHHAGGVSVGVPGTVAGLHLAWTEQGRLPWARLVEPAITLARDGFTVSHGLADSLEGVLPRMAPYPTSTAQFSRDGAPYRAGDVLVQSDLARTLEIIAELGPEGFYEGQIAELIAAEVQAHGGLMTTADLARYEAKRREPVRGTYRGYDIVSMPPPSSGGIALVQMLNVLEAYDLGATGFGSADNLHLMVEAMRRAYADRARYVGDADFTAVPVERLTSKEYAAELRATIDPRRASTSAPDSFTWPVVSDETTHFSVVDADRNAVSVTYTLEGGYGSKITVTGAGFLLNNEMGDFNAAPGLTTDAGLIGTQPNLAAPFKRPLSSMTPTIVSRDGELVLVTGSPGGRTIINTVLQTIVNVIDFEMNAQEAVSAGRFHHQWLPDRVTVERHGFSPDTIALLEQRGHAIRETSGQGAAEVIAYDAERDLLMGASDLRRADGAAVGVDAPRD